RPLRDRDRKAGGRGRVRVLVGDDIDAVLLGTLDQRGGLVHLAPVALLRGFVMRKLHAHAAAPADLEVLLDRREELVALVADVTRVEAVTFADHRREGADLIGRAVRARWVDQPGGQADRTVG